MLRTTSLLIALSALTIAVVGCGSGGSPFTPTPSPEPPGGDPVTHEVGPLVIRTAAAAGFVAEDIPTAGEVTLVALHGATIQYLASQAMLDRIVFASERGPGTSANIWLCDLNGSNAVQLTDNNAVDTFPSWSPDGTQVVFQRMWPGQDIEIIAMDSSGSSVRALTSNTDKDVHPSFGPSNRRIAFSSDATGNPEIYTMYLNGTELTNISGHSGDDTMPDWSSRPDDPTILFCSTRYGPTYEVCEAHADDPNVSITRVTTSEFDEWHPAYSPDGQHFAATRYLVDSHNIFVGGIGVGIPYNFSAASGSQDSPAWTSDGSFICYASFATGDWDLVLHETAQPRNKFAITSNTQLDFAPDLGSPTMQTDRVLIGPAGSDWGGNDPIWASAYAGIVALDYDGYRSFVRIGISPAHVGSLEMSPLASAAGAAPGGPTGVLVEATRIVNLREDAGRGCEPTVWDLDPLGVTAAALYFDSETGKLITVLALDDAAYPSAAGSPAVTEQPDGSGLVVTGSFAAVFDASGNRVAGASSQVFVAAEGPAVR